jgi:hypothetical protein
MSGAGLGASLLPHRPLEIIVAILFAAGAVLCCGRREGGDDEHTELHSGASSFWRVA